MFGIDFYPTPPQVIETMLKGVPLSGTVLEPSAGSGNIVDALKFQGIDVIACEIDDNLRAILANKCPVISNDFLHLEADRISHVKAIIMNPPFSKFEQHFIHAWNIAPAGCYIVSLCNFSRIDFKKYRATSTSKEIEEIIKANGTGESLGNCFDTAERKTGVEIGLIRIQKPANDYNTEFEGFFTDDEPEGATGPGLMPYNVIRDLVQRYIQAVQIFDEQLQTAIKLNSATSLFNSSKIGFYATTETGPIRREEFKKSLQRSAWKYIIDKFNLQRYATKQLRDDINKFIEEQQQYPFTMKNIYAMLQLIVGTASQRMEKAAVEVFNNLTKYHEDNRLNVPGWKTNSHFLLTRKFILPYIAELGWSGEAKIKSWQGNFSYIEDLERVLCWMLSKDYSDCKLFFHTDKFTFGEWHDDHEFFRVKLFKKGTGHFEFKDEDTWAKFNGLVAKALGYPLYEPKKQTAYQDKQTGHNTSRPRQQAKESQILFEFNL